MLLGLEEGNFYKPREASLKVKCFVVVTIRNSLLETIASVDYKKAGLEKYIEDEQVKNITMDAIRYFNALNLRKIAEKLEYCDCDDIYFKLENQYKMAWKAFNELYCCGGQERKYEKIADYQHMNLKDLQPRQEVELKESKSFIQYESVISPVFNNQLINMIKQVINTDMPYFFIDCFKHLTRNVEKLFQILEILLQRNKVLLTSNYYIASNYVAKRTKLLRATHKTEEIF